MDKQYNPKLIEQQWSHFWEEIKLAKPREGGENYCIMLPPPNVTGTLHIGHAFQQTLMDVLIRYQRMLKKNILWQSGTDHAGISTQILVERQLIAQGKTRQKVGREAFVKEAWHWHEHFGNIIHQQMRRLGISLDMEHTRFTMGKRVSKATREAFIRLYREGLIYRGQRMINWDPSLLTTVSVLEVEKVEVDGQVWHIRYPLVDSDEYLVVASTRPELLFANTAIAVHPEDQRYQHLIGQYVRLPLTERTISIIADKSVDPQSGTGCIKITPAHDFIDYEIGRHHNLPIINVFTLDAKINENGPREFQGLDRFEARKRIVTKLEAQGLIEKVENKRITVPIEDRSGSIIEPYLTNQWFVNMKQLAAAAISSFKKDNPKFIQKNWGKTYLHWLENIEHWCISRQLWWGHRIPVWYDHKGQAYVGHTEKEIRENNHIPDDVVLTQDEDVLDTWFSASLWPFATLGWPEVTENYKAFYPTQIIITGFDIIFFWVARMVMMGLKLTGKVPFKNVYLTGLIRDAHGSKMSKTKGNVIDPIDIIDGIELSELIKKRTQDISQPQLAKIIEVKTRKNFPKGIRSYGTDALRFTFCTLATNSQDINFDLDHVKGYYSFCIKIWNAARFTLLNIEDKDLDRNKPIEYSIPDRWIRSALQNTIKKVHQYFKKYRFDLIASTLYEFIRTEYCDWYIELAKYNLSNPTSSPAQLRGTYLTLLEVLEKIMRLLHPLMPFITEEIWQKICSLIGDTKTKTSINLTNYPEVNKEEIDKNAEQAIEWLKKIITPIRSLKSKMDIHPATALPLYFHKGNSQDREYLSSLLPFLQVVGKIGQCEWVTAQNTEETDHQLEIHIPLGDFIDEKTEIVGQKKHIEKLQNQLEQISKILANENFINKAPTEVVEQERKRLKIYTAALKHRQKQEKKREAIIIFESPPEN